jgi:hypothetical protein
MTHVPQQTSLSAKRLSAATKWPPTNWRAWLGIAAIGGLSAFAVVLVARRAAGALVQSPAWQIVLAAVCGLVLLRVVAHRHAVNKQWQRGGHAVLAAVSLLVLAGLWLPDASPVLMLLCAVTLLVVEALCWTELTGTLLPADQVVASSTILDDESTDTPLALDDLDDEIDPTLVMAVQRNRQPDGGETIAGTLQAEFAAGQRTADLHLSFCPPLSGIPQVEAETIAGPPARVKVAQVLHGGLRLEVRLDSPASEPTQAVVQVLAALK